MAVPRDEERLTSLRNLAGVTGGLAGLGGITHGVGEMLQGSRPPAGLVFDSWAQGRIARNLGGEPAMTVIPNLLITGALTILVSLAVMLWAVAFVDRRHGGRVLALLSLAMLLVGGGFAPPLLGTFAGLVAAGAQASREQWSGVLAGQRGRVLALLWPALFWLCLINALLLVIGSLVVAGALGLAAPDLFVNSLFLALVSMPLATLAGIAYDLPHAPGADTPASTSTHRRAVS
jgi:hypothetical protein